MLLLHNPWSALLGAAIVLAGLPVRWLLLPATSAPARFGAGDELP